MKKYAFLLFLLSYLTVSAQKELTVEQQQQRKSRRDQNFYFLQQTLNYSALSYASLPGFDRGSPKGYYLLSSDIVPQFVIGGDWMPFPVHLTPRYKVRIFRDNELLGDSSSAVRTPSYMPGGSIYVRLKPMDDAQRNIYYSSLSVFHHSNGQDGDEFVDGRINTYNGNFSTNYLEPAFHFRKRNKFIDVIRRDTVFHQPEDYFDFYGRIGYEIHFNTTDTLKSSYGTQRLNITLGLVEVIKRTDKFENTPYYRERNRLVFNSTLITGPRDRSFSSIKKRLNFDLSYYFRIPSSPNTALFTSAGYYGSDPYNIYYMDSYWFVRAGLSFGFFVAPITKGDKTLNKQLLF